jgi:L-rhamnose-H+ transport protein
MTDTLWIGLLLTLIAGVLAGNSMLPMKFARRWQWENTWLVFSVVSLVVLPWALALALVPNVWGVYARLAASQFLVPLLFGAGWGIAQVLFGLSIARLGLALGYAVIIGLGALLGTLVPLFVNNRAVIGTPRGTLILSGVAVMVAGIAVSAWAGQRRETAPAEAAKARTGSYALALTMAIVCGLMAPMINYSFAFGQHIAAEAVRSGAPQALAGYAVWPVSLFGGLIPNLAYSAYLLSRNRTWRRYQGPWLADFGSACLMGVFWMGAMALYGVGSVYLGALGTSVGWALFQIFMIMTATLSGVLTGEWRSAPKAALRTLWCGLALLAAATAVIAAGNRQ